MKSKKNIFVLTYWSYKDALIQTYTIPYLLLMQKYLNGGNIWLLTLEQPLFSMTNEEWKSEKARLRKMGIRILKLRYVRFGIKATFFWLLNFFWLLPFLFIKRIEIIHTWCTPAGAIGLFLSWLSRKKLVLDSFEPHAQPMVEAGEWSFKSKAYKLLFWLEKKQAKRAFAIIACVPEMKKYCKEQYKLEIKNFLWKPACVNFNEFNLEIEKNSALIQNFGLQNKIVCVYSGKFGGSYLTKEVFCFLAAAEKKWGDKFKALLLTNHPKDILLKWAKEAGVSISKLVIVFVNHKDVPNYLALADFGLTPFVPVPSKRYGSPIKTGEYLAMGLPVVITAEISNDSEIIKQNNVGSVISSWNNENFNLALDEIELILCQPEYKRRERICNIALEYKNFNIANETYHRLYEILFNI